MGNFLNIFLAFPIVYNFAVLVSFVFLENMEFCWFRDRTFFLPFSDTVMKHCIREWSGILFRFI